MKSTVKAALVQHSPFSMWDKEKNASFISEKISELARRGNELIVFPEMSLTNFYEHIPNGKKTYWDNGAITFDDPYLQRIIETVKEHQVHIIIGIAERSDIIGNIYNSALLIGPEGIVGIARKVHFPGLEKLYFTPGSDIPVFDTPLGRIGICICYDCMFPEHVRMLASKGAEIIAFPSSIWKGGNKGGIGALGSKEQFWRELPAVRAVENQCFIIACNGGGTHDLGPELGTWERMGLSKIVSPSGKILAQAEGNQEEVLEALLEREVLEDSRSVYAFLSDRRPNMYKEIADPLS